jgi:hypothetical protein
MSYNDKKIPRRSRRKSASSAVGSAPSAGKVMSYNDKKIFPQITRIFPQITQKIGVICGLICVICGKSYVL